MPGIQSRLSVGSSATVCHPALLKASLRVNRWLATSSLYRCWLSTHSPDCRVEWASQLMPPKVGEVTQALCVDQPALGQHAVLLAQDGVDARREARTLDGDLPVAFDEDDEDVLAAQAGQQVRSGDGGLGVGAAGGLP